MTLRRMVAVNSFPRTKLYPAALLIGCSPDELSRCCYGVGCDRIMGTYKRDTPENRRAKENARNRAKSIAMRASSALTYMQRIQFGLVSPEERALHRSVRRKAEKAKYNAAVRARNAHADNERHILTSVRRELSDILRRVAKVERALSAYQIRFNKPWHLLGFLTLDAWAKADPVASAGCIEERRKTWQVRSNNRRALVASAVGDGVTRQQWIGIMSDWGYRCAYCNASRQEVRDVTRKMDLEMDHVVPLPHGPNTASNIVPACKPCNTSKSDNDLLAWAEKSARPVSDRVMAIYSAHKVPA